MSRRSILARAASISLRAAAEKGVWARCRHISLIFDGNRLVSVGRNSRKSHPANLAHGYGPHCGTHSEMVAILKAGDCRGLTLVNIRVNKNGALDQSRPCQACMRIIRSSGIAKVFHTDENGGFTMLQDPGDQARTPAPTRRRAPKAPLGVPATTATPFSTEN